MGNRETNNRGRRKRRNPLSSLLAVALAAVMAIGILPQYARTVYAAEDTVADADTRNDYIEFLGDGSSTRYNGRVWTDKSVSTEDVTFSGAAEDPVTVPKGNSDFLMTYSLLGTSQRIIGQQPSDTVFILDFSTSMTWGYSKSGISVAQKDSRIQAMVDSVNSAIDTLISANPANRIAIVVFNGSSTVLLEKLTDGNAISPEVKNNRNYLEIYDYKYTENKDGGTAYVRCNINGAKTATGSGTNIQAGLFAGMSILADNNDTDYTVDGTTVTRIPNVVFMSDGAPTTFSSSSNAQYENSENKSQTGAITNKTDINENAPVQSGSWWESNSGEAIGSGNNDDPDSADGFTALLTAAYFKNAITRKYYDTLEGNQQANIYTIGFATDVQDVDMAAMANLVLDPGTYLDTETGYGEVDAVAEAWTDYSEGNSATVRAPIGDGNNNTLLEYIVSHPTYPAEENDPTSLVYPTEAFTAQDGEELNQIFSQIATMITSAAQGPTAVTGDDPVHDGYVTYTDPIGEYMHVDDVKALIWAGKEFKEKEKSSSEGSTTYIFSGAINSPAYGNHNANEIKITVTETDGKETLTVQVPASAIPLRVNTLTLDGNGQVTKNESNNAYPLRLVYGVSLNNEIIDAETGTVNTSAVSQEYLRGHTENGEVRFYSNLYTGKTQGTENTTVGDAAVTFTPASTNPFYFLQEDTPIYSDGEGKNRVESFDSNKVYYVPVTYYNGTRLTTDYVARAASTMVNYYVESTDGIYLKVGAPRLGNIAELAETKNNNQTGTAASYFYPTFEGEAANGNFKIYLGNNGKLSVDVEASLTVRKDVTADTGLTAPDEDFSFALHIEDKAGLTVNATRYTDGEQQGESIPLNFDNSGEATFTLKGSQSLVIPGMAGVAYTLQETDLPDGFSLVSAVVGSTADDNNVIDQTIYTDTEVVFTNNYSLGETTASVSLQGQKLLEATGSDRTLEKGDFSFQIEALGSNTDGGDTFTEDAAQPMPATTSASNAADGSVSFESMRYTAEMIGKTYGYRVTETIPKAAVNPNVNNGKTVYADAEAEAKKTAGWTLNGIAYDSTAQIVKVTVGDDQQGHVTATVTPNTAESGETAVNFTFTNTYAASGTLEDGSVAVEKTLLGRDEENNWLDTDTFQILLKAVNAKLADGTELTAAQMPMPADSAEGEKTITLTAEKKGASIGAIPYTQPGTYHYTLEEVKENPIPGITYSDAVYDLTVTVSDNGDGTLQVLASTVLRGAEGGQAEAQSTANTAEFVNTYVPETATLDGSENLTVTKNLNREWIADDPATAEVNEKDSFTFTLSTDDEATRRAIEAQTVILPEATSIVVDTDTVNGEGAHQASFGDITFTKAGTYVFTIAEEGESHDGLTYDKEIRHVAVEVTDNTDGTMTARVTGVTPDAGLTFTNIYQPESVTLSGSTALQVTKKVTGASTEAGFTFNLQLTSGNRNAVLVNTGDTPSVIPETGISTTVANGFKDGEEKTAQFGDLIFTEAGDYTFVVTEAEADGTVPAGWTYDNSEKEITVRVTDTDLDGRLEASVTGDALTFTNSYAVTGTAVLPGSTYLTVKKELVNIDWKAEAVKDGFTFLLSAGDDTTRAAIDNGTIQMPAQTLTITAADEAADYAKSFGDIVFSAAGDYSFVITEQPGTDTNMGYDSHEMIVKVYVRDNGQGGLNITTAAPEISGSSIFINTYSPKTASLVLSGQKILSGRDLQADEFSFVLRDADGNVLATVQNDADGNIVFPTLYYGMGDAGTYTYEISEVPGDLSGVIYDSSVVSVVVEVSYDPGTGLVAADCTMTRNGEDLGDSFTFTNSYAAPTEVGEVPDITAMKTVAPSEGNTYTLQADDFTFLLTPAETNPASDPVDGRTVTNDTDGNVIFAEDVVYTEAGTYQYTVRELSGSQPGILYDDTIYTITAVVEDSGDHQLDVTSFTITREDGTQADAMTFENRYDPAQASVILGGTKTLSGAELKDKQFSFRLEAVTEGAPMPEAGSVACNTASGSFAFGKIRYDAPGTYIYRISEINDGQEGYTYDGTVYTATVTVTDENGVLRAQTAIDGGEIVFSNSYSPIPVTLSGETAVRGTKVLTGRDLAAEEFSFQLLDADGQVVSTAVNGADGSFVFGDLTFTEAGTYYYTVQEVNTGLGGVDYDTDTVYTVVITVKDAGGHLEAAAEYQNNGQTVDGAVFNNTYTAEGTAVRLSAMKVLSGRTLEAGEFSFQLKDDNGTVIAEAVNDASGAVVFPEMTLNETGTYHYTISEVQGSAEQVTYDDAVYGVTITVSDNLEGNLTAEVAFDEAQIPVFRNVYTKTEEPSEPTPGTTDQPTQPTQEPTKAPTKTPSQGKPVGAADTGDDTDNTPYVAGGIAGAAVLAALIAAAALRRKRSK